MTRSTLKTTRLCKLCQGPLNGKQRTYCSQACQWARYRKTDEEFLAGFWSRVQKTDGCWIWTGAKKHDGYGLLCRRRKMIQAHRLSWELVNGPIPAGQCALHRCDTPACVNPAHLFLGTRFDNAQDAKAKGRNSRGTKNPHAKLTESQVIEIRKLHKVGRHPKDTNTADLMAQFNVSRNIINSIICGRTWKHVK